MHTPLSIALGRLDTVPGDRRRVEPRKVETSLDRIQEIVTDLSTLARFGAVEEVSESVSLSDVAPDAWEMIDSRSATLRTRDCTITGDRSQLQGLFENLFRNAIGHGGIDVTVRIGPLSAGFTSRIREREFRPRTESWSSSTDTRRGTAGADSG